MNRQETIVVIADELGKHFVFRDNHTKQLVWATRIYERLTAADKLANRQHASQSPGPVNCNLMLQFQGQAHPTKCERCGNGGCPFFHKNGDPKPL